ncbi:hypothetical protein, partial [Phenylobacterium sp.]|uniref:hypothetical protein n=1 Tax=Phenylobacterium sp. TaxID=1871053 RepID=UPI00272F370F
RVRYSRIVKLACSIGVLALALPLAGLKTGLSQTEQFRATPESVTGQEVLAEHFPADPTDNPNELPDAVILIPRL